MKLRELIERLEEIEEDLIAGLGDDVEAEVVCAIQPNYPLAVGVHGACVLDDDDTDEPQLIDGRPIVWIATAGHPPGNLSPYAPRSVWDAVQ
jgi:hypothetical protein